MEDLKGPSVESYILRVITLAQIILSYAQEAVIGAMGEIKGAYNKSTTSLIFTLVKYYVLVKIGIFAYQWISYIAYQLFRRQHLDKLASRKKKIFDMEVEELQERIKGSVDNLSKDLQDSLIGASVLNLHDLLFSGKVTSVDLVNFYTLRCIQYGPELNLVADFMYDYALQIAQKKDEELAEKRSSGLWKSVGDLPCLHGIPVSVKDVYEIKGHDTTLGSANNVFRPEEETGKSTPY